MCEVAIQATSTAHITEVIQKPPALTAPASVHGCSKVSPVLCDPFFLLFLNDSPHSNTNRWETARGKPQGPDFTNAIFTPQPDPILVL